MEGFFRLVSRRGDQAGARCPGLRLDLVSIHRLENDLDVG